MICKLSDLIEHMRKQLDPTKRGFNQGSGESALMLQVHMHKISAWNLTGKVISLSVGDFSSQTQSVEDREQLAGLVDAGTSTHTPAVGYNYPSSHKSIVLRNDKFDRDIRLYTITSGKSDTVCVQVHMDYRFDGPIKPPITMLTEALILQELQSSTANAAESAQKLVGIDKVLARLDKIAQATSDLQKKSYLDKIIDGVKHTAMIVAAVADEQSDADLISSFEHLAC